MSKKQQAAGCRLGKVGGSAVLEGVMMRAGSHCATACRTPAGEVAAVEQEFVSVRKKHKFLNLPLIRGVVSFIESMKLSIKTLNVSAEIMGDEEELQESKFEKWLKKHFGKSIYDLVMFVGLFLGFALAIGLFFVLPNLVANGIEALIGRDLGVWKAPISSLLKVIIFITYILLITLMPDIRRTFQYHGAEHKTIACYEAGEALTPENAKKYSRFHPRCGTSFMFVMILLGLLVALGIRVLFEVGLGIDFEVITGKAIYEALIYTGIGLLTLPIVMGLGFEFLMIAGKHDNWLIRLLSAPGLWMQRLTTKEPDEKQLECAIVATMCAMPEEFPEFDSAPYINKGREILQKNAGKPAETSNEEAAPAEDSSEETTEAQKEAPEVPASESAPDEARDPSQQERPEEA